MSKNEVHVVPGKKSGWVIKHNGVVVDHFDTQAEAIKAARALCQKENAELVIHGKNGRIRAKDSHGKDPFPPKG